MCAGVWTGTSHPHCPKVSSARFYSNDSHRLTCVVCVRCGAAALHGTFRGLCPQFGVSEGRDHRAAEGTAPPAGHGGPQQEGQGPGENTGDLLILASCQE